ncbi:MAG: MFS transporter [Mycobacterium sp.]
MSGVNDTATRGTGSWRELLGPKNLSASAVLAGGVALYATNEFLTISLMPSAVADIGGHRYYAWVTAVYLVGSVVAATTVHSLLTRLGPRGAYLLATSVFGAGSLVCAGAPMMDVLLVGRAVQGAAGGLLAGLGYAVINTALPSSLWTKGSALVSAMWGVGTLIGPAVGGLFSQLSSWRGAFGILVVLTAMMAALVPAALPGRTDVDVDDAHAPFPVWSLLLLGSAALTVSVAGIPHDKRATAGLLALGITFVVAFLFVDRRVAAAVLPPSTFGTGPLKWIYLTLGLLMGATMVDMYVPFFGQRLAHLTPVAAGFLGVALAIGWTTAEFASASLRSAQVIRRTVAVAPLVMAFGLALGALTMSDDAPVGLVAVWAAALLIAGVGVGMAWPHLSAWAMSRVDDPAEGPAAAAAINTVQLICGAFGAGLVGVAVNLTDGSDGSSARWLFALFAVLAAFGVVASMRSRRQAITTPAAVGAGQQPTTLRMRRN